MGECFLGVRASREWNREEGRVRLTIKILIKLLREQCSRAESVAGSSLSGPENMEVYTWALSKCPITHYSSC